MGLPASQPHDTLYSDRIFSLLVDSVRDYAIFVLDPKGYILTWNPGAHRIKGYTGREIVGKHFSIFYPEADIQANKPAWELQEATRDGRFEDEGWRLRKDGSRFWANVIITRLNDETGRLIGFGKITRDLTERRQAELRYRLLIEGAVDYAIYSLDPNGVVTGWNSGAQRIKGYSAKEIIGQHFSRFYTPEDVASGMPQENLRKAAEKGHHEAEGWRVRKDGARFWSNVTITALQDDDGKLVGFSKITRDVTDRKILMDQIRRHAEELEQQIAEKEQSNAELEAFSYSVSHDLRAPLRAIEGFSTALRDEYSSKLDEQGREFLDLINNAVTRMNRLIGDLINYGRLNRVDIEPEVVNLDSVIPQAIQQILDKHPVIVLDMQPGLRVLAHEATLSQVLYNLITNGLKFHAPGIDPRVEVKAFRTSHGAVRIEVHDNGIGIAEHHQERIFRVFERLHDQQTFPGTGIGLAIVKRGVQRMGGTLGLASEPREGSTFWIELPSAEKTE